jgi:hypothetical protein
LIVEAMPLTAANLKSENSGAMLVNHRGGHPTIRGVLQRALSEGLK